MKEILKGMGAGCLLLTAVMTAQAHDGHECGPECTHSIKKNSRMKKMEEKGEMRQRKRIERLTKELNLSEEQQKQISGISKEGKSKIAAERRTIKKMEGAQEKNQRKNKRKKREKKRQERRKKKTL